MSQWTADEIIAIVRPHVGEKSILGARAPPLTNHNDIGPRDCAEFVSWCAYQAYGILFGTLGSDPRTADPDSGQWYADAKRADTLISAWEAIQTRLCTRTH